MGWGGWDGEGWKGEAVDEVDEWVRWDDCDGWVIGIGCCRFVCLFVCCCCCLLLFVDDDNDSWSQSQSQLSLESESHRSLIGVSSESRLDVGTDVYALYIREQEWDFVMQLPP